MRGEKRGEGPQAKRLLEKRRKRGTVSSLRPSRAFLIRRERKKKRRKKGQLFAIEMGNSCYPERKRKEKK